MWGTSPVTGLELDEALLVCGTSAVTGWELDIALL